MGAAPRVAADVPDDSERLAHYYAERDASGVEARYDLRNRAHLYTIQSLERDLLALLDEVGMGDLAGKRLLDVGCGDGSWLLRFAGYGVRPDDMAGIDLLPGRLGGARSRLGPGRLVLGNAERLPLASGQFDLVTQFVTLSSVLDKQSRRRISREMLRVLAPGGAILSYDFIFNPLNRQTRGLPQRDYRALFPGCSVHFHRVTLAPPLARWGVRGSWIACEMMEKVVFLRSHYLALVRPLG